MTSPTNADGSTGSFAAPAATSPVLGQQPPPDTTDGVSQTSVPDDQVVGEPVAEEEAAGLIPAEVLQDSVGQFTDSEGRVHWASAHSKPTLDKVRSGEWQVGVVEVPPPFDPTGKHVKDIVKYLRAHAGDQAEVARVQLAEAEGEDRVTIRQWTADS